MENLFFFSIYEYITICTANTVLVNFFIYPNHICHRIKINELYAVHVGGLYIHFIQFLFSLAYIFPLHNWRIWKFIIIAIYAIYVWNYYIYTKKCTYGRFFFKQCNENFSRNHSQTVCGRSIDGYWWKYALQWMWVDLYQIIYNLNISISHFEFDMRQIILNDEIKQSCRINCARLFSSFDVEYIYYEMTEFHSNLYSIVLLCHIHVRKYQFIAIYIYIWYVERKSVFFSHRVIHLYKERAILITIMMCMFIFYITF